MEHFALERHLRRTERIVGRKDKLGGENATLKASTFWATGEERLLFSFSTYISIMFTHAMSASHSKKFSSVMGPATIPSGGFWVSSIYYEGKTTQTQITIARRHSEIC